MSIIKQINKNFSDYLTILVLDNEVTTEAFVHTPPLTWARLSTEGTGYTMPNNYPTLLTREMAEREKTNWDQVDLTLLQSEIMELKDSVGLIVIGNNAAQGLPLARAVPERLREKHSIIIYGSSLPEKSEYQKLGFRQFSPRTEFLNYLKKVPKTSEKKIALVFINTIQHNEKNYHQPWNER